MSKIRNALFAHDGPIIKDINGFYYGVSFNEKLKTRYFSLAPSVTFLTRVTFISSVDQLKYSKIENTNFRSIAVPNFKSIKLYIKNRNKAKQIVEDAVNDHTIIVARLPSSIGKMAVEAARKYNKPYLVEFVACTFDAYWNYSWQGKLIAYYKLRQQQRLLKGCPYVMYVTKEFLQKRYPTNGKSISCSNVELKRIEEVDLINRLKRIKNHQSNSPLILGTVASLNVKYKGQEDVIAAIGQLKQQGIIFHYKLVGQGDASYLKNLIQKWNVADQVEILGPLPHDKVFSFFENIDLYIQPSKQEGLPRALIEAMSKGCPSLGANTAGIPELISSKCIFEPGNVSQIIRKISSIDKDWLVEQAQTNFENSKDFNNSMLAKRRLNFYQEFLKDNSLLNEQ